MNELTWKWTMIRPEMNPTAAQHDDGDQAGHDRRHAGFGLEPTDDDQREGEHRPDRQVERAGGQRDEQGEAEDGDDDLVGEHQLERRVGEERLGDPEREQQDDEPEQVQGADLVQTRQVERRPPPGRRDRRRRHPKLLSSSASPAPRRSQGATAPARCGSSRCRRRRARRRRVRAAAPPPVSPSGPVRRCRWNRRRRRRPLAAAASTRRWMSAFEPTSTPWVGSSSTSTRGSTRSQRAITTFWALPPDSSVISFSDSGGRTSSSLIHLRVSRFSALPLSRPPLQNVDSLAIVMFSRTQAPGSTACVARSAGTQHNPRRSPRGRRREGRAPRRRRPCRRGAAGRRAARRPPRGPIR